MAKEQFRLAAKLHLAEYRLEQVQASLADEQLRLLACAKAREHQAQKVAETIAKQRQAALSSPDQLGQWQVYLQAQNYELAKRKKEYSSQMEKVEQVRNDLIAAYQEVKKLEKLKQKHIQALRAQTLKREQAVLDESAQLRSVCP